MSERKPGTVLNIRMELLPESKWVPCGCGCGRNVIGFETVTMIDIRQLADDVELAHACSELLVEAEVVIGQALEMARAQDPKRFAELVSQLVPARRRVRQLQQRTVIEGEAADAARTHFFPPPPAKPAEG